MGDWINFDRWHAGVRMERAGSVFEISTGRRLLTTCTAQAYGTTARLNPIQATLCGFLWRLTPQLLDRFCCLQPRSDRPRWGFFPFKHPLT
jgi:hypothetical protein